ncbi:MAG TPA: hypothetical protein VF546_09980 [Pyrinomonadaceae bacterium]|jgi:hypothetical protein
MRSESVRGASRRPGAWLVGLALGASVLFGQVLSASVAAQKSGAKEEAPPSGTPVLWRAPEDITARDLAAGPGGKEMQPDLSNVTFVEEETGGYSVKWRVKDGAGQTWVAKLGNEARPETAAVRLVWAVGYVTEINYLVPCAHVKGAPKPRKDIQRCEGDGYTNVRFEARPADVKRAAQWSWKQNPFTGTKELKGLVVLMALLNNWDLKDENNRVIVAAGADGANELRYVISDLGATFGKTGNFISHSRNEPEKFVKTKFVGGIEGGRVRFAFNGKQGDLLREITVEDARWIGGLLAQLSDQQLQDAFRAANFTPAEVELLTAEVRDRVNELAKLGGEAPAAEAPAAAAMPTPTTTPTPTPTPTPPPTPPPAAPR